MSEVRRTRDGGYSLDFEEGRLGVCCIGFAVHLGSNRDRVAISITGPSDKWTRENLVELAAPLLEHVRTLRVPGIAPLETDQSAPSPIR